MSFLNVKSDSLGQQFDLACTSFSTQMTAQMSSVQTRKMQLHFPVKADQPEVSFDITFRNEADFERFQRFARAHQLAALNSWPNPEVVLWWPERDITNWSGIIKNFRAGGARRNPAPKARLTIDLIDSVFSKRTTLATAALQSAWQLIAGYGSPAGMLTLPSMAATSMIGIGGGVTSAILGS